MQKTRCVDVKDVMNPVRSPRDQQSLVGEMPASQFTASYAGQIASQLFNHNQASQPYTLTVTGSDMSASATVEQMLPVHDGVGPLSVTCCQDECATCVPNASKCRYCWLHVQVTPVASPHC